MTARGQLRRRDDAAGQGNWRQPNRRCRRTAGVAGRASRWTGCARGPAGLWPWPSRACWRRQHRPPGGSGAPPNAGPSGPGAAGRTAWSEVPPRAAQSRLVLVEEEGSTCMADNDVWFGRGSRAQTGGAGAPATAASDPFGVCVTSLREVSGPPLREPRRLGTQEHCPNCGGELKTIAAITQEGRFSAALSKLNSFPPLSKADTHASRAVFGAPWRRQKGALETYPTTREFSARHSQALTSLASTPVRN